LSDTALDATIRHLAAIDRPSASPGEREAAEWIAGRLRDAGLEPQVEEERVHGGFWWPWGLLHGLSLLGGRLPSLLAFGLLVDDLDHRERWFRKLLPKRSTWNVWAEAGDRQADHTLVIVAHHDAAHTGLFFDPSLPRWFARTFPDRLAQMKGWPRVVRLVVLGPLMKLLGFRRLGRVLSLASIAMLADIGRRAVVPGANDNLTGVAAVLALAESLGDVEGLRVVLVSTGSEESNSEGMQAWGRRHFAEFPHETTTFLALDTLGSGRLVIVDAEGFLIAHRYDRELCERLSAIAERIGVHAERLETSFATDGEIAHNAGYRAAFLGSIDEYALPANYHQPTDTPDNVDLECVADAVKLTEALVRELAQERLHDPARPPQTVPR
jgi:hypothetical protein